MNLPHSDTELVIATVRAEEELLVNACNLGLYILLYLHKRNLRAMRISKYRVVQPEPIIVIQFSIAKIVTVSVFWSDVTSFVIS